MKKRAEAKEQKTEVKKNSVSLFSLLPFALLLLPLIIVACGSAQTENGRDAGVIVVNAPAAGQVRRILVNEGSAVGAGSPVVEIMVETQAAAPQPSPGESADARAARNIKAAEAAIEAARAEVVKHEAEVMRLTPLVASGQASQAQLDAARSLYEQAQRRLQQAQDASKQAQGELLRARQPGASQSNAAQSSVPRVEMVLARATSTGTVAVISARVGDRVTSGQPLATIRTSSP